MVTPKIFIEAIFIRGRLQSVAERAVWADHSTSEYFIFESAFGTVRLRRRSAYPQTFARVEGSLLQFGYGDVGIGATAASQPLKQVAEQLFCHNEFMHVAVDCVAQ